MEFFPVSLGRLWMSTPMARLSKTNKQKNKATSPFGGYENPERCCFREGILSSEPLQQSSDLMRQLPVQTVPELQTLLCSAPLSNTRSCCIPSHPSDPRACLLRHTVSQQRSISLPCWHHPNPAGQADGHQEVCMQKLKWEADTCTTCTWEAECTQDSCRDNTALPPAAERVPGSSQLSSPDR